MNEKPKRVFRRNLNIMIFKILFHLVLLCIFVLIFFFFLEQLIQSKYCYKAWLLIALIAIEFIFLIRAMLLAFDIDKYKLLIYENRIVVSYGIIKKRELVVLQNHIQYCKIQSFPLQRLLGASNLIVFIDDSDYSLFFPNFSNVEEAKNMINKLIENSFRC